MKLTYFLLLGLLCVTVSYSQASDLCSEKIADLKAQGKRNIECDPKNAVDFGFRTFSTDYQNPQGEPLSAPVGWIKNDKGEKVFENHQKEDFGINNLYFLTEQYRKPDMKVNSNLSPEKKAVAEKDAYGASSLDVVLGAFETAIHSDPKLGESSGSFNIVNYIQNDLSRELTAHPEKNAWNGRCMLWSVWNASDEPVDVQFKELIGSMKRGVLCDGTWPLSVGVLKELWTAMTVEPRADRGPFKQDYSELELKGSYSDRHMNTGENIEDANLAMVKLQDFGADSEFKPEEVVKLAQASKAKGEKLIFDLNAGFANWNQPIESVVEVSYEDPSQDEKYLTVEDLQPGPDGIDAYRRLLYLELSLKKKAIVDDDQKDGVRVSLSDQVDELKEAQSQALRDGTLVRKAGTAVVHHQVFIQYGIEGEFGNSKNQEPRTRVLDYVKVGDRPGAWAAPSKRLSQACSEGFLGERDKDRDSLFAKLKESCVEECAKKPSSLPASCGRDREIFVGSLPPKTLKFLRRRDPERMSADGKNKLAAQEKLIELIKTHCPTYDQAAVFLDKLKSCLEKNSITPKDQAELAKLYPEAKSYLSESFIEDAIRGILPEGDDGSGVSGLTAFRDKIAELK